MQQRVNTANPTTASLVSHRKANCSSEKQEVRHDAACWNFWFLIKSTGSLCLTVDMDCTVSITAVLPFCPEWHPANTLESLQSGMWPSAVLWFRLGFSFIKPALGPLRIRGRWGTESTGATGGSRFGLGGWLWANRRGYGCRLGQCGEPGGHGRLGAGQCSTHWLTWRSQRFYSDKLTDKLAR